MDFVELRRLLPAHEFREVLVGLRGVALDEHAAVIRLVLHVLEELELVDVREPWNS